MWKCDERRLKSFDTKCLGRVVTWCGFVWNEETRRGTNHGVLCDAKEENEIDWVLTLQWKDIGSQNE